MTDTRQRLARRISLWLTAFTFVALVELPRHEPPFALGLAAIPAGAAAGAGLFAVLSRRGIDRTGFRRERVPAIVARSLYLAGRSGYEEVIWRGIALSWFLTLLAAGPALALTTLAFALSHYRSQGWRMLTHLATGAVFGGVFIVSGSLGSAIAAHATYNVLVGLAVEATRRSCPERPIGGPLDTAYHASPSPTPPQTP